MIQCQKHLFDLPPGHVYLQCAATAPMMKHMYELACRGVSKKLHPWKLVSQYEGFEQPEICRSLFAQLVNATADDITLHPSVSYGISIAANSIPIEKGQSIVTLEKQFPSNVYPWIEKAKRTGARVVQAACPKDDDWTGAVIRAINSSTAVVAIPQCHWIDGAMLDLVRIANVCRVRGVPLVLDLTQSLGAIPFDVQEIRPAFATAATEKWLLGPAQMALMYVAPEWHKAQPIEFNWIVRNGSSDYNRLTELRDDFETGARRLDVGERGNYITLPVVAEALRQILRWGVDEISATINTMSRQIVQCAENLGLKPTAEALRAPHMIGVRGDFDDGLVNRLAQRQIYVSQRDSVLRIAPHVYNNESDIQLLFEAIEVEVTR